MQRKPRKHRSLRSAAAGSHAYWAARRYFQFIFKPQKLMRLFGLIGYPLTHSFSKNYFTEKFKKEGIENCRYENFELANISSLSNVLDNNPGLEGLNVTIPYKESVLPFLNEMDEVVKKI